MGSIMKKVAIIGTNGLPAKYGGFETLTDYLSRYLNQEFDLTVYCAKTPREKQIISINNSKLIYIPFKANGWQSLIYDALSIFHALKRNNVLVILGFSGVFAFPFRIFFKSKIIFNIGGVEWKKVRGKKSFGQLEVLIKKWFERICVHYSDLVIADNQVILDYVRETYKVNSILAEYGGNHAVYQSTNSDLIVKYPFLSEKYDVTVSRAQEDMNIHLVIEAYKKVPERNLVVVSNWEISEYGKNLKKENKDKFSNIFLLDAVYDVKELNVIRSNGEIYIHTHSLCGTAPSLTEAMFLKLPIICFDVNTNRATTENKSYYFNDTISLIKVLRTLKPDDLIKLQYDMNEIAQRRYRWERIVEIYRNCIN
jgi:glycosyltransferase involved in cell wall biosynthesis